MQFVEMFGEPGKRYKNYEYKYLGDCCIVNPTKSGDIVDDTAVSFVPMTSVSEKGEIDSSNKKSYGEVKKRIYIF